MHTITWQDFEKIDIRTGTIIQAEEFPEARKSAYKLMIDFGAFGIRKSSAQITALYTPEQLIGQQVIAVVNFPPKQIATYLSECLVLGVYDEQNNVVLLQPAHRVGNGLKIG
ncbi:MAG: tRNA-binding protein [Flavisolibacter sp.]|nr:tRNA-binding protein [Flavisolibacter sp.]